MSKNDQKSAANTGPASAAAASELDALVNEVQGASAAPNTAVATTASAPQPSAAVPPATGAKPAAAGNNAATPLAPATVAAKPFTGKLATKRMKLAEQVRNVWTIVPEYGVPYEAIVKDPAFLSHVSSQLRPFDRIEVLPEDGSYFAELLVRSAGRQFAVLAELRKVDLAPVKMDNDARFQVTYQGAHSKHVVIRIRDRSVLKDGFDTAEDAHAWLATNVKSLAA